MPILTVQYPNPRPSKLETQIMIWGLGTIAALMISVSMTRTTEDPEQLPQKKVRPKGLGLKELI